MLCICQMRAPAPAFWLALCALVPPSKKTSYGVSVELVTGAKDRGTVSSSPLRMLPRAKRFASWRPQWLHILVSHSQFARRSCVARGWGHHVMEATAHLAGIPSAYNVAMILPVSTVVLATGLGQLCPCVPVMSGWLLPS